MKLKIPIIVEGKYDKARLSGVVDAVIIPTDGFGVFKNEEKRALIRRLGQNGLILLCDSDGGGRTIRSHLRGMLSGITIYDLYTPAIKGKEARKPAPSKEGILGVEGVSSNILRGIFESFASSHPELVENSPALSANTPKEPITKSLMFELGLNGCPSAAANRDALSVRLGLPTGMNVNGLCAALNLITDADTIRKITQETNTEA